MTEPRSATPAAWWRCDDALLFDHRSRQWWAIGAPPLEEIRTLLETRRAPRGYRVSAVSSVMGCDAYKAAVERAIEYIRAGDVYQVNLAHELRGAFEGSTRDAFAALAGGAAPAFGAYLEHDASSGAREAVLSVSPELFLEFDERSRRICSRPMKGTRPGSASPDELRNAVKDRAELNMIIDLVRNDLGRICELGSVRVDAARSIERHAAGGADAGILQATGTVSGVLREGAGAEEILRAAFPAGSVTGAPKIRAMQIIDELEPSARGLYCGSIGYLSDCGRAQFNVAIRTAVVRGAADRTDRGSVQGGLLSYRVGAGIVADSIPDAEWEETLVKAGVLGKVARVAER